MAKAKKKEALSLEEKLEQALVPIDEQPYELPKNWCWVKLGEVVRLNRGSSPRPIKSFLTESNDGVNWIKIGDTDAGKYINETKEKITKEGAKKSVPVKAGDLLLTNSMSYGKPFILNIDGCIHDGWFAIETGECFDKDFLYYSFLASQWYFDKIAVGTAVRNISSDRTFTTPLAMPPLAEQKRIVEQIESLLAKLDEAKDKIQNALSSFEIRKKTIISKAVSGELTKKWREYNNVSMLWEDVLFEDVARAVDPHPSHRTPKECFDGIPYVGIRECNYSTYQIDFDMARKVNVEILEEHKQRYCLQEGDFIIGKIGTIGKPFQIPAIQDYALSANVVLIQPIKERINPQFMLYFFQSDEITRQFEEGSKATTQSAFGIQKVRKMSMRIPAILEQEEIVRIMQNVLDGEHRALEVVCGLEEQIELMKKSILAKAFRGELGTNHPDEESAVELLKQIIL